MPEASAFDARSLIAAKRDGGRWTTAEIDRTVGAICGRELAREQLGAWLMAACLRGLDAGETRDLTLAMLHSGRRLDFSRHDLPGPVVDKHSTGGVGDLVSLVLAPMLAAAGCCVPMISGRSLGAMGGTLDKLESVPGLTTQLTIDAIEAQVARIGLAIVGATPDLVPADRLIYAARDVTGTVDSLPLIVASILSKKLAESLEALALDVKFGSGAVNADRAAAEALAQALRATAADAGLATIVVLSDMSQPLAPAAGNALEVALAVDYLTGAQRPGRLHRLVLDLGTGLLAAAGVSDPARRLQATLPEGRAAERLGRMVAAQGGPTDFVERCRHYLPAAPVRRPLPAPSRGRVDRVDAGVVGEVILRLGGGRMRSGDHVDRAVGVSELAEVGAVVEAGDPLVVVHGRDEASVSGALEGLARAFGLAH